jgi:hypothetical protein
MGYKSWFSIVAAGCLLGWLVADLVAELPKPVAKNVDDDSDYVCACGWTPWDEGRMNRSGTYEPMVAWSRITNHDYECPKFKPVESVKKIHPACQCTDCRSIFASFTPPGVLVDSWMKGPVPPNTWYWGAVVLVGQKHNGFYFADFCGSYVLIDIDGDKRRVKPADVAYYNNSLKSQPKK